MKRTLLVLIAVLAHAPSLLGQTEENLRRAIALYQNLEIERARDLFLQVISPTSPFVVTQEDRVIAYKYLGAAFASLNRPDSAVTFFRAAIERDAFADLDPEEFTEIERRAFAVAKRRSFRVGVRPVLADTIDPRSESVVFQTVTTHDGLLRVEVAGTEGAGRGLRFPLFNDASDGLREVPWSGNLPQGGLVPSGTYALVVTGRSTELGRIDSTTALFTIQHQIEPLEDTIRAFRADELKPEEMSPAVARSELLVGLGVAGAALLVPPIVGDKNLGTPTPFSLSVAGLGVATGLFAFLHRSNNSGIPENIAENQRRRLERQQRNDEIRRDNADRIARTQLIFAPATGVGR